MTTPRRRKQQLSRISADCDNYIIIKEEPSEGENSKRSSENEAIPTKLFKSEHEATPTKLVKSEQTSDVYPDFEIVTVKHELNYEDFETESERDALDPETDDVLGPGNDVLGPGNEVLGPENDVVIVSDPEPLLECRMCKLSNFATHQSLLEHFSIDHSIVSTCEECTFSESLSLSSLSKHIRLEHNVLNPDLKIATFIDLRINARQLVEGKIAAEKLPAFINIQFPCIFCPIVFKDISDLKIHLNIFHYFCKYCNESFNCKTKFQKHKTEHFKTIFMFCNICNCKFKSLSVFYNHMKIQHRDADLDKYKPARNKIILDNDQCLYCDYQFTSYKILSEHMKLHSSKTCEECKLIFLEIKPNTRLYTDRCENCEFKEVNAVDNNAKIKPHTPPSLLIYKYPCLFCSGFMAENALYLCQHFSKCHLVCKVCLIQFSNEKNFIDHGVAHQNNTILQIKCLICSKTFNGSDDYVLHHNTVHPSTKRLCKSSTKSPIPVENSFKLITDKQCPYCNSLVVEVKMLLTHLERCHNVLRCEQCGNGFISQDSRVKKCRDCYSLMNWPGAAAT